MDHCFELIDSRVGHCQEKLLCKLGLLNLSVCKKRLVLLQRIDQGGASLDIGSFGGPNVQVLSNAVELDFPIGAMDGKSVLDIGIIRPLSRKAFLQAWPSEFVGL